MKTRNVLIVSGLLFVGLFIWFSYPRRAEEKTAGGGFDKLEVSAPKNSGVFSITTSSRAIAEMWQRFEIEIDKRALEAAVATGDPKIWAPILGQARHFNLPREKGIALLLPYLHHPESRVRAAAAQYLFELGSRAGGPVLVEFLKEGAQGRFVGVDLVNAAAVLHQYRYPVDPEMIYKAHQATPNPRLRMYAQLLGSTSAIPETKERLKTHGLDSGALMMAGIMRLNDSEAIAIYEANFKSDNALQREVACSALYRVTGEPRYLDYLIATAEAAVGLRPKTGYLDHNSFNASDAFRTLQHSVVPEATEALKRIEAAARKNRRGVEAERALMGLYYFHRAYDYIDGLIMAQFTNRLPEGLPISSIWDLAAARRTPEIEAAAQAYNREAYEREFLRKAGRPVESWIFQYIPPEIPWYVRPPLSG